MNQLNRQCAFAHAASCYTRKEEEKKKQEINILFFSLFIESIYPRRRRAYIQSYLFDFLILFAFTSATKKEEEECINEQNIVCKLCKERE